MESSPLQLGVFDLLHVIGEGGMGEIWLGVHREQQVQVAIKILREDQAKQAKHRQSFLREVQSFARLLHPGIIRIFDYGEIPQELATPSHPNLTANAPYIAMELATRGSLAGLSGLVTWRQLKWMLIEVLNALAHAHARNLIHRDLKPDNILLTEGEDGQTCVKLTDFGIVHISDPAVFKNTSDLSTLYAGTPVYMSPEQLRGRWRDFGPWTDLYALGCVAFEQTCGRLPFEGDNLFDIAHQQLAAELPPFTSKINVPDGFEDWVRRLLEKNPQDRFQRAADAAWALMQLPEPEGEPARNEGTAQLRSTPLHRISDPGAPTMDDFTLELESEPQHTTQNTLHSDLLSQLGQANLHSSQLDDATYSEPDRKLFVYKDAPPPPARWHRRRAPAPSIQLMGAGLGLYGLREIPFVSRERERDLCWEMMLEAFRSNSPRAVLIRGSTGVGKTRMMQWLGERAHEVGSAIIMRGYHSPEAPPTQGFSDMIARQLNTGGLTRKKAFSRIKDILTASATHRATADLDTLSLTALLFPDDPNESRNPAITDDGPRAQLNTPRDRFIVTARLLEYLCAERPVFIFLDDAHWSTETLESVRLLLTEPQTRELPIFIMLSINDDAQTVRPASRRLIGQLCAVPSLRTLELERLEDEDQRKLVDALLMLEDPLADKILDLSRGNPMFAVQLVGEWIQRDILTPSENGYTLREGTAPFLPDTLDQLWGTRLSQLLRTVQQRSARFTEAEIRLVLEVSATLGQQVSFKEWGHTCMKLDLAIPSALVDAMITQGFATADRDSWSFTHEQIRKRLMRQAQEEEHWEQLNRACAAMIDTLYSRDATGAPERLVNHLIEANATEHAIAPLFYLIQVSHLRDDYDQAEQYLDQLEEILFELELPPTDTRVGRIRLLRSTHILNTRGVRPALALLEQLAKSLDDFESSAFEGEVLLYRAKFAILKGQTQKSKDFCDLASERFAEVGDQLGLGSCFLLYGQIHALQFAANEAKRDARSVIEITRDISREEHPFVADNLLGTAYETLGYAYTQEEKYEKATLAFKRAIRYFKEVGNRLGVELAHMRLGDIARYQGGHDAAERFFLDSRDRIAEVEHGVGALPSISLALMLLETDRIEEARELLEEQRANLERLGYTLYLLTVHLALATCHAILFDEALWREHFEKARIMLEESGQISRDIANLLEQMSEALCQEHPLLALECYPLAIAYLEKTGGDESALHKLRFRQELTTDRLPREEREKWLRK